MFIHSSTDRHLGCLSGGKNLVFYHDVWCCCLVAKSCLILLWLLPADSLPLSHQESPSMILAIVLLLFFFLWIPFCRMWQFPSVFCVFNQEWVLKFFKWFLCIYLDNYVSFLLYSINMVTYIDFQILNCFISRINLNWLWCITIFTYC